jgi:hypothetical protein
MHFCSPMLTEVNNLKFYSTRGLAGVLYNREIELRSYRNYATNMSKNGVRFDNFCGVCGVRLISS